MLVSGQFFRVLQTAPLMGRYLTPEDDRPGGSPEGLAVVITEQFWETWFDRAPDVVGRKLIIANVPFNVVGVMPKRFIGADPTRKPQIFAPLSTDPIIDAPRNHIDDGIHAWWLTVGARLRPGVTLSQANASLATVSRPILHAASDDAEFIGEEEKGHFHFVAEPGSRGFAYARLLFRRPLLAMFAMCGGILLLACLNLAGLLMARGAARERELATRLAIGATRRRLIQQLLVESLLIAILGTTAGLAVAPLVSRSLAALLVSADGGWLLDTSLDVRVLCFAACVAVISAVLIGLVPAVEATAGNVHDQIKDGQHARPPAPASGYVPIMQDEQKKPSLTAVVRTDGPQVALASAARSLAARLVPTIPAPTLSTMNEVLNDAVSTERMMALLSVFFAGCALLVTAIGLYGTLAYATARRTSEIGIRMALGAQRMGVMVLVFRENALVASIGSVAGLTIALLVSRALGSFLYGTSPRDPWVLLGSVAALTLIASVASLLPALRAARIDPMAAIRCE
jgi:ABC-type lipoprotein release transport system permease subunit